ncbi:hypothetical protein STFE110948_05345 [Streptobacillus felis]|uniref:Uncharacterized protein n=2 Tax=Streptobacillus felis TaxID=1384509 RepID=A0A7Z0PFG3_9FUSO|nr:hypothetical protein [Streptobacillus felis]NYV28284.1 hypothetical protein [Streptobacillus felis]
MLIETILSSLIFISTLFVNYSFFKSIYMLEKKQKILLKNINGLQNLLVDMKSLDKERMEKLICDRCIFDGIEDFSDFIGLKPYDIEGEIIFSLIIDRGVAFIELNGTKEYVLIEK